MTRSTTVTAAGCTITDGGTFGGMTLEPGVPGEPSGAPGAGQPKVKSQS